MLSGGGDSVALLDVAVRAKGPQDVEAVHVNYGLRSDAALDQLHCEQLCDRFGVRLHVHAATLPERGNLHANARNERYRVARQIVRERGIDWIATAHTADDQAETVLYRLASSPGRRALRGIAEREGNLIRPLLGVRRSRLRAHLAERGLEWREDSSNADPRFARARVRRILAALEDVHTAAVANINATATELRLEEDAARELVLERLETLRAGDGTIEIKHFAELHPAVAALALRELAEEAAGRPVPVARHRVADLLALSARGGTRHLDLGGGAIAEIAYGRFHVYAQSDGNVDAVGPVPGQVKLGEPGAYEFRGWQIEVVPDGPLSPNSHARDGSGGVAAVPASRVASEGPYEIELRLTPAAAQHLHVRSRRQGDRLRPRGLGGTKSLQDVFVDRKIPRALRDSYPVVCCGDEIVWVPGVVTGEPASELDKILDQDTRASTVRLLATPSAPDVSRSQA